VRPVYTRIFNTGKALARKQKLLWMGDGPVPSNLRAAAGSRWNLSPYNPDRPLSDQCHQASVVAICPNGAANDPEALNSLLNNLDENAAVALLLLPSDAQIARKVLTGRHGPFMCADEGASAEEISAKLSAAAALQPTIVDLRDQLSAARNLSSKAERSFEEFDEQMRLAARLQRDFLPRRLPEVGSARFGVLYRPATWVSGDIYDVTRLDENHIGFYVVDAVGHGMPAALLTMFIKKALQTKRIAGHSYEIIPPNVSMDELNSDICEQNLSSCQFCTAVYCVLDTSDLTLTYCRAGHPDPLLIHANGRIERLSLLGVFPEEQYTSAQVQLHEGDRLVLYTDGAEDVLARTPAGNRCTLEKTLGPMAHMPRDELLLKMTATIDNLAPEAKPEDDITILMVDILKP